MSLPYDRLDKENEITLNTKDYPLDINLNAFRKQLLKDKIFFGLTNKKEISFPHRQKGLLKQQDLSILFQKDSEIIQIGYCHITELLPENKRILTYFIREINYFFFEEPIKNSQYEFYNENFCFVCRLSNNPENFCFNCDKKMWQRINDLELKARKNYIENIDHTYIITALKEEDEQEYYSYFPKFSTPF